MHEHADPARVLSQEYWDERYGGEPVWSGRPNALLVRYAAGLPPGVALDVGSGEGADVLWLAQRGWTVTGADFSGAGLARAARHAEEAGVAGRTDWWQVDAREFAAGRRAYDLVSSQYLHPPDGGMVDVARRLAGAVAPGGHLLIVGHAPPPGASHLGPHEPNARHRAMFLATDLLPGLPEDFEPLVVEQRPRSVTRGGETIEIDDSTLLVRRRP